MPITERASWKLQKWGSLDDFRASLNGKRIINDIRAKPCILQRQTKHKLYPGRFTRRRSPENIIAKSELLIWQTKHILASLENWLSKADIIHSEAYFCMNLANLFRNIKNTSLWVIGMRKFARKQTSRCNHFHHPHMKYDQSRCKENIKPWNIRLESEIHMFWYFKKVGTWHWTLLKGKKL